MSELSCLEIPILARERDFLILDKPNGVGMHDEGGEPGLISQIRVQENDSALYPVHRLDKDTSGVLIVARGNYANQTLSGLFQDKKVTKGYWAIGKGKPTKKQGAIIGDLLKARNGAWKLSKSRQNPSVTQFYSYSLADGLRAYLLKPYTGKTHQLRVVLKALGSPIVGDVRYKGMEADRMYLHASHVLFSYRGIEYEYTSIPKIGQFFRSDAFVDIFKQYCFKQADWPELKK